MAWRNNQWRLESESYRLKENILSVSSKTANGESGGWHRKAGVISNNETIRNSAACIQYQLMALAAAGVVSASIMAACQWR
jgi:hypothetical protein